jgi:hypothetical protein
MSSTILLKTTDVDIARIQPQAAPATLKNGSKALYFSYNHGVASGKLDVISPQVSSSFGLSDYQDNGKFSIIFNYYTEGNEDPVHSLRTLDEKFDEWAFELCFTNWEAWFGKTISREIMLSRFSRLVKPDETEKYPPRGKVGAQADKHGNFMFTVFNGNTRERLDVNTHNARELVPARSVVQMVMTYSGIWLNAKGEFGLSRKIKQLVVFPQFGILKELVIPLLGDAVEEELETMSD